MSYPKWWDKSVTLFNRYEDESGAAKWYKTILHGCFVKLVTNYGVSADTGNQKEISTVRIRCSNRYIPPAKWLNDGKRAYGFTLMPGDIIIPGTVNENIDEYESGLRPDDILNKYKAAGAFTVRSVTINGDGGLKHYKAEGI